MIVTVVVLAITLGRVASAQCAPGWLPGDGVAGADGPVDAMIMWDPDGIGPRPPLLVVGGRFRVAGSIQCNHIATYDLASGVWSPLGAGLNGPVYALAVMPDGNLVAGGGFLLSGTTPLKGIAKWDGAAWTSLGQGMRGGQSSTDSTLYSLTVLSSGDLIAGGDFTSADGIAAIGIAKWNGLSWSALGQPVSGARTIVYALQATSGSEFMAGGDFTTISGVTANRVARWTGQAWMNMGSGTNATVRSLSRLPNGAIIAGGEFNSAGGISVNGIARWFGGVWTSIGLGVTGDGSITGPVTCSAVQSNGDLIVGGNILTAGGATAGNVVRWDGTSWSNIGAGLNSYAYSVVALPNDELVVGGIFTRAGSAPVAGIARFGGTEWAALAPGGNGSVNAIVEQAGGGFIAGGRFTTIGGTSASLVARWNGSAWSSLGTGLDQQFSGQTSVEALATLPNGHVVAGGTFRSAGGVATNYIARWDGSNWLNLGSGLDSTVKSLAVRPNGELIAGGFFLHADGLLARFVARWNGAAWTAMGSGTNGNVFAVAALSNGDVIVGGNFTTAGGLPASNIARWNGTTWSSLGTGLNGGVSKLAVLPNGNVAVAGSFSTAGGNPANKVAIWNGSVWLPAGDGPDGLVTALTALPSGDLIVGGSGGATGYVVARWSGGPWSVFGSGFNSTINAIGALSNGDVAVGGYFTAISNTMSAYLATFRCDPVQFIDPTPRSKDIDRPYPFVSAQAADAAIDWSLDRILALSSMQQVVGAACDGVTRVVLKWPVPNDGVAQVSLADERGSPSQAVGLLGPLGQTPASTSVAGLHPVLHNGRWYVLASWSAPSDFWRSAPDTSAVQRIVQFNCRFTPAVGGADWMTTAVLSLRRPPVLLLHGLWSDELSWKWAILHDPRYTVWAEDYSATNDASFYTNRFVAEHGAVRTRAKLRNSGYATTRVMVVGHSMGGLLARIHAGNVHGLYYTEDNLGQGDFYKMITVYTPHFGSGWGCVLQSLYEADNSVSRGLLEMTGVCVPCGAVLDLRPTSEAIRSLPATTIPTHAISGVGGTSALLSAASLARDVRLAAVLGAVGVSTTLATGSIENDLIVGQPSAFGDLSSFAVSTVPYDPPTSWGIHIGAGADNYVGSNLVFPLLDEPIVSVRFASGMSANNSVPFPVVCSQPMLDLPSPAPSESLAILLPAGASAVAGGMLSVDFEVSPGFDPVSTLITSDLGAETATGSAPAMQLAIPSEAFGTYQLRACALDAQSRIVFSAPVSVNITSEAQLQSIQILNPWLPLGSPGTRMRLTTIGNFTGSLQRDITPLVTMTSSDSTIVATEADGIVRGVAEGEATVTVMLSGLLAQATVKVWPSECRADFNHSGAVTIQDIFDFLSAWFAGSPAADINTSGSVSLQDIFDYLTEYFTGCP